MAARTTPRILIIAMASLLALPGATQAQDDEAGLCAALDLAAVSELTGLEFDPAPEWDYASECRFYVGGAGLRSQKVALMLTKSPQYEALKEGAQDVVELTIEGWDAFGLVSEGLGLMSGTVFVDLGPRGVFSAQISMTEGSNDALLDHTIEVAQSSVARLGPLDPVEESFETVNASGIELPEVEGITWQEQFGGTADQLSGPGADTAESMLPLAEAVGTDLASVSFLMSEARDAADETIGIAMVMRLDGAEQAIPEDLAGEWLVGFLDGTGLEPETVTVDGKDAMTIALGPNTFYLYVNGHTLYWFGVAGELGEQLLAALP